MTQTMIRVKTKVLSGSRVEFTAPELAEGTNIELIVMPEEPTEETPPQQFANVMEFLKSLPPSKLTMEDWERIEESIREEKNSWGD